VEEGLDILRQGAVASAGRVIPLDSLFFTKRNWLDHQGDDGGKTDLRNVGRLTPVYTALQPRRRPYSNKSFLKLAQLVRGRTTRTAQYQYPDTRFCVPTHFSNLLPHCECS
jgi:hypothetical protein